MTNPTDKGAATALVFQAPPSLPETYDDLDGYDEHRPQPASPRGQRPLGSAGNGAGSGPLRMLKGARAAAAGMKISDEEIRAVLDDPDDVQPDPNQPTRTRLQRDGVTITTGNDGMILRVTRKR